MSTAWTQAAREAAYTSLCEAVSAAGNGGETAFLARLSLLLAEDLADPTAFARALAAARANKPDEMGAA